MDRLLPLGAAALLLASVPAAAQDADPSPAPWAEAISAEQPYPSQFVEVEGVPMHYVEAGSGAPFLFIHGNPTSSYLWRNVMPHVEPLGRVIALDLVGFGQSGRPDIGYTLQEHQRYVDGFIEALALEDVVLVLHDWGSVLGLDYARRHEDNVRAVAFMEPLIPPAFPMASIEAMGPFTETFRGFRDPEQGRVMIVEQNMFIEGFVANATVTRTLSEAELNAYREPFADPADREPILVWPNELPIAGEPARNVEAIEQIGDWLTTSDMPKLLLYARPGAIVPPEAAAWMAETYRNLDVVFVGYGLHYIQEDNPEAIGRNIAHWYRRTFAE